MQVFVILLVFIHPSTAEQYEGADGATLFFRWARVHSMCRGCSSCLAALSFFVARAGTNRTAVQVPGKGHAKRKRKAA